MLHVVITGSRDWPPRLAFHIWEALHEIDKAHENERHWTPTVLHHGECPYGGADLIAASWADGAGWQVRAHPPIKREGWAYAKRNQEMIDLMPSYVVACFLEGAKNRGTSMTYDMAIRAGLKDRIVEVRA